MGVTFSQLFPPKPTLTEANLPSQHGKVFLITGGASGIGHELANILYHAGGKVYIAARSESNALQSIEKIKKTPLSPPSSSTPGELHYLHLTLEDLSTIKSTVQVFHAKEQKLHVLFNNAGVSLPPPGSISKQNHELQLAVNCLGPYLLTQLLLPSLQAGVRASHDKPAAVRVVWTSSQMVDLGAIKGGINPATLDNPGTDQQKNYTVTKVGNWFLASQLDRALRHLGILSVSQNPGNLKTNILRHAPAYYSRLFGPLFYEAKMGAYTELWAGLSQDLTIEASGAYILPWGRLHPAPRKDLLDALKSVEEGGTGQAEAFADWCEKQVAPFK
ncbi:MAG: hypothetical protein L6R38_008316 [Xanthoria sp. 2 TBL-2021]|nr:MAG: hypothetical protein L6R38_008316 [Xanthoria sp. 2 TBL-2021]